MIQFYTVFSPKIDQMDSLTLKFTPQSRKRLEIIYVVDDSQLDRRMMVDYLSKYPGLKVKDFSNGDECLKQIVNSGTNPDIILLDYFLDTQVSTAKDGLEILVKLKEMSPNTSIIMHTSVENERVIELARKKGASNYIVKGAEGFEKLDSIIENDFILPKAENS